MSSPATERNEHQGEQRNGRPALSRRTVVRGAAWSVPVVVLATAAPAASASDQQLVVAAIGPLEPGATDVQTFVIDITGMPDVPASSPGNYEGFMFDFCLPPGLRIDSVSGSDWDFFPSAPDDDSYAGFDSWVYNRNALTARAHTQVLVLIRKDPALTLGISGDLGADATLGPTGLPDLAWSYTYGAGGQFHANCAAFGTSVG